MSYLKPLPTNTEKTSSELVKVLKSYSGDFASIVPIDLKKAPLVKLNLSGANPEFATLNMEETEVQEKYIWDKMKAAKAVAGVGGYGEKRGWYKRSENYHEETEVRSIHLGIDIWMEAGTIMFAPLSGIIHSFKNNAGLGDYGPTIILEHQLEGIKFYSLYGHLSEESLIGKSKGMKIQKGEKFAEFGNYPINGDWPPHIHFQLITSMLDKEGDFPGVAAESQKDYWMNLCPDPNLILECPVL